MGGVNEYRRVIREIILTFAEFTNAHASEGGTEAVPLIDEERDHFAVLNTGWIGHRRVRGTPLLLRIRNGKVWIDEDWTEQGICKQLVAAGIPAEDIVLAFQSPKPNVLTEAVS